VTQHPPFLNIAHRGARAFAPENTLAAIRMARRLGANVVELDIQMSRDGELIVFHDDDVHRCSDGASKFPIRTDYSVSAFTWDELSVLDVGTWYVHELARSPRKRQGFLQDLAAEEGDHWITAADADEYTSGSVRIPRLRDALAAAHECDLAVILEIKTIPRRYPGIAAKTVALIRDLKMESETLISSFDHALLADIRGQTDAIATGVLTAERLYRPREYVEALGADAFEPGCADAEDVLRRGVAPEEIDADGIRELTDAGLLVNVWTENAESRMRALIDAGVTGIITDYPNRLAHVLAETGGIAAIRPRMKRA
jgi:glycerophosphoryl diester phosphodiesterase